MAESSDFQARFRLALKNIGKKTPPPLEYDTDSSVPVTLGVETTPPGEKLAKVTSINLFQQPEVHPVILDLALLKKYELEWLLWEPETLVWRIPQDFHTSGVSDLNLEKIQSVKTLHFNDNFWNQWEVFNWCLHPFNNLYTDFEILQVPSTAQIMVAVNIAAAIRSDVDWGPEVKDFMAVACRHDGIFYPPAPLLFLHAETGTGLVDGDEIMKKWPGVQASGVAPTQDTVVDEQLRRMLDAHNFLEASRNRFQDQLRLVSDE